MQFEKKHVLYIVAAFLICFTIQLIGIREQISSKQLLKQAYHFFMEQPWPILLILS